MKENRKKWVVLLLFSIWMVAATGCGKKEAEREDTKNCTYEGKELVKVTDGMVRSVAVADGKIYYDTMQFIEDETKKDTDENRYKVIQHLYCVDKAGGESKEITIPDFCEEGQIYSIAVDEAGSLLVLLGDYNSKDDTYGYRLAKLDTEGRVLESVDITKELHLDADAYISNMKCDEENILLVSDYNVYVLDYNMKQKGRIHTEAMLTTLARMKDGSWICGCEDIDGVTVRVIDTEKLQFGAVYPLELSYFMSDNALLDGSEYDFYYITQNAIYGYTIADQSGVKIFDYLASNVITGYQMLSLPDGSFLGIDTIEDKDVINQYVKIDPKELENKKEMVLGAMYLDDSMKQAAISFNKTNRDYRIVLRDYSNAENPIAKMNADIIAGNIPDMIALSGLPIEQYAAKGLLEDLTPYIEQDADVTETDYVDSVMQAMKTGDKQYYVSAFFDIVTMIGSKDKLGTKQGWTMEEMLEFVEEQDADTQLFYYNQKSEILTQLLTFSYNNFVNWQDGSCSFDSEEFKALLTICNAGEPDREEEDMARMEVDSRMELFRNGDILFESDMLSLEQLQLIREEFGGEITCIGYPAKEGNGSCFLMEGAVGIYSGSKVKDGAWQYMKILLSREYQMKNLENVFMLPTRKDCMEEYVRRMTTKESYRDEYGTEVEPITTTWYDGYSMDISPASKEDAVLFESLINSTHCVIGYDEAILDIVLDEAKGYFNGDKSVEETAKIIQNRVATYVNEMR